MYWRSCYHDSPGAVETPTHHGFRHDCTQYQGYYSKNTCGGTQISWWFGRTVLKINVLCLHNVLMLNLEGFGKSSIPNCLMAYQQRKKKLCKASICLFLSGIVNSICAHFVTRCSPLYNPGRSHPELMLSSLSTGTISFSYKAKRLLKLIASKSCSKCYFYFIKHL